MRVVWLSCDGPKESANIIFRNGFVDVTICGKRRYGTRTAGNLSWCLVSLQVLLMGVGIFMIFTIGRNLLSTVPTHEARINKRPALVATLPV